MRVEIRKTSDNTFLSVFNSGNIPGEKKDGNKMLEFNLQPEKNVNTQQKGMQQL